MTNTDISGLVARITDDVKLIVADEIALAKAELRPAARRIGVGSGMFGGALWFVISATIILWFVIAAGFAWIYAAAGASAFGAVFFGVLTTFVLVLIIAGVLAGLGIVSFKGIHGPTAAPQTTSQAFAAVSAGVTEGSAKAHDELRQLTQAREQLANAKAEARATRRAAWSARFSTDSPPA